MRFLVAPTAYKGTLTPTEAAEAIARALPAGSYDLCPIADGGTGWLEVWQFHFPEAQAFTQTVQDALGRAREARWLLLPNGVAVLESAQVCGLHLLAPEERAPLEATSYGVGELIRAVAMHPAVQALWLGLGGVATTDGGLGALAALGFHPRDAEGELVAPNGAGLLRLHVIEPPLFDPLLNKPLLLCADVQNTLLDAARIYAPQKGATPEQVAQLEHGLQQLAAVAQRERGVDLLSTLGAGAAGGLAGGLHAYLDAPIVSGIMWLLRHIEWDARLQRVECLITGEGQVDAQTLMGKGVGVLIQQAVALGKSVIVLAGRVGAGGETLARLPRVQLLAVSALIPNLPPADALARAVAHASRSWYPS